MDQSIAIYKYVFNSSCSQYRSDLQYVVRTTHNINHLNCIEINHVYDGELLKSLYITNENALQFVALDFETGDEYYMVISDIRDYTFPVSTKWRNFNDRSSGANKDFDVSSINLIKTIIPDTIFWKNLWEYLNMEL